MSGIISVWTLAVFIAGTAFGLVLPQPKWVKQLLNKI